MKNILVSIFVYITLARTSDRCTEGHGSYSEFKGNSDINPPITPIVPSFEHPCPSNKPGEATLQNMLDSIKGCIKKIKEYEIEADEHFKAYKSVKNIDKTLLDLVNSIIRETGSDPEKMKDKEVQKTALEFNLCKDFKYLEKTWAQFRKCKELIKTTRQEIKTIIKDIEVKFPFESQSILKQFEKIPQYLDARDCKSEIIKNIRIE